MAREHIHTGNSNEYDRIYRFYQTLERRDKQPKLLWISGIVAVMVALMIAVWLMAHPIDLHSLGTPFELMSRLH